MRRTLSLAALAGAAAVIASLTLPAVAGADGFGPGSPGNPGGSGPGSTVYVQTNDPTGNQVVTYLSSRSGLHEVARTDTGGLGVDIQGSVVDKLASQGSLVTDPTDGLLVGVNGGSNTISVFHAFGPYLSSPRVVSSGGTTPVSVAARGDLIYVLDAGGAGSIQGYYANTLTPVPGSNRSLGLTPGVTPAYLNTPGQIGFTPNGRQLIVTTKANGSDIDVFNLTPWGSVTGSPVVNPSATPVPFGFTFDRSGDLVVTEAGTSALTTYSVAADGTVAEVGSTTDGLAALCWVATNGAVLLRGQRRQRHRDELRHRRLGRPDRGGRDRDRPGSRGPGHVARRPVAVRGDRGQRPRRLVRHPARRLPGRHRLGRP